MKAESDILIWQCFCGMPDDYKAMDISNEFIVGYGLDYNQQGRNLPDIYKVL